MKLAIILCLPIKYVVFLCVSLCLASDIENKRLLGETIKELRGTYKRRPQTESLYRLRLLKRAGVRTSELLNVYRSGVSSILEYAVQLKISLRTSVIATNQFKKGLLGSYREMGEQYSHSRDGAHSPLVWVELVILQFSRSFFFFFSGAPLFEN